MNMRYARCLITHIETRVFVYRVLIREGINFPVEGSRKVSSIGPFRSVIKTRRVSPAHAVSTTDRHGTCWIEFIIRPTAGIPLEGHALKHGRHRDIIIAMTTWYAINPSRVSARVHGGAYNNNAYRHERSGCANRARAIWLMMPPISAWTRQNEDK